MSNKAAVPADSAVIVKAREILNKHWGHSNFRAAQVNIIETTMSGGDCLGVLPTGYGKSATFQVPAMLSEGVTIAVSPLIALMKDQADDCVKRGIPASFVNSHVTPDEQTARFSAMIRGEYKLFYVAPERLNTRTFIDACQCANISRIVIDEAHCVSRWGHDFRPAYRNIHKLVKLLSDAGKRVPILAVTATATADIEEDIAIGCGMTAGEYTRVVGDPVRPNLNYLVLSGSAFTHLRALVSKWDVENGRYVVYSGTRKGAEMFADAIGNTLGKKSLVGFYHAGMKKTEREAIQDAFKAGRIPVIVATCAFGMGIDVPNIRAVIHTGIPGSLEDYCQEAGRAGRDGDKSDVILVNDPKSLDIRRMFLENANPAYAVYEDAWKYLHTKGGAGTVISETAEQVAEGTNALLDTQWNGYQVGGALATMEAYGLVTRGYSQDGTGVSVKHALLKDALGRVDDLAPNMAKVVKYLWEEVEPMTWDSETVEMTIDKGDVAGFLGMPVDSLNKCFKTLEGSNVLKVTPSFRGKSTQVARFGVDLDTVLPRKTIEEKRAREENRLNQMIGYTQTKDRVQFIRAYFMAS